MATKTQNSRKKRATIEVITQMLTLATSGFGFVAALAWNNFIQELVNSYVKRFFPQNSGVISLFLYALLVTALAVLVTLQLTRVKEHLESK